MSAPEQTLACVNGQLVVEAEAKVSIFDRGYLFGDAVYEVIPILDGRLIDRAAHRQRLERSLRELEIPSPLPMQELDALQERLVAANKVTEGRLYIQISRGPAERDFLFPQDPQPTLTMFTRSASLVNNELADRGLSICCLPDQRWARCDIKTVMLLAASMTKQAAKKDGFDDAWMIRDGLISEATSSNAFILRDGIIYTHPLSNDILAGCTRKALLKLAAEQNIAFRESAFTLAQAQTADEAFMTSASSFVMPVVSIDGHRLGNGTPGPISRRLREIYIDAMRERP